MGVDVRADERLGLGDLGVQLSEMLGERLSDRLGDLQAVIFHLPHLGERVEAADKCSPVAHFPR